MASNSYRRSDLRLLLGVMGAPLAPVHVCATDPLPHLSIKDTPIETSSAQYILQQYTAASGVQKLQNPIRNAYALGKVKMLVSECETGGRVLKSRHADRVAESGGFVLCQMHPDMWYVELAVGGSKVHAGCNGKLVWRHTPWLGAQPAKGPARPLRRALQWERRNEATAADCPISLTCCPSVVEGVELPTLELNATLRDPISG
ncbi:hypothetical protein RJ639_011965 [Escallonia herrerae]|uniref:Uncharacterized protein n=1 Tax=Escallonia herrerae TaxID=1293975 RepID=A0AA88VNE7_9ASTE|nr:hypothetical protein RJ639_011965 [Escallonia herrerae]